MYFHNFALISAVIVVARCCFLALTSVTLAQQTDPRERKLMVLERLWNEAQVNP